MIKSDSRRVKEGDAFVAIKGIKNDGHNYIESAIKNGAKKVIVEHGNYSVETEIVKNTKDYLKQYVKESLKKITKDMTIIGITGTNGKTTTSYLIYQALNNLGIKCAMIGTLGYYKKKKVESLPNTCPDLALIHELFEDAYKNNYKCVVLEASSQGLEEERLYGIEFDYAIFTNLTHDHLDYHKNIDNYIKAKQKLFKALKPNGISIINVDDEYYKYFTKKNTITYGFKNSDYQILEYENNKFKYKNDKIYTVEHKLIGKHNAYNIITSIIVLEQLGIKINKILKQIKTINPPSGRMEIINYNTNKIIVDYAHTPDAIMQVLNTVKEYDNLYAVFGCTGNRDKLKRPIMTNMLIDKCKKVIITSDDLYDEEFSDIVSDMLKDNNKENYEIIKNRKKAIEKGISLLEKNDVLLVLGKGHEQYIKEKNKLIKHNDGKFITKIIKK